MRLCCLCDAVMHCVVPSSRLPQVCGLFLVPGPVTAAVLCGLTRARRRALVTAAARNEPGQPTLTINEYLLSVENKI